MNRRRLAALAVLAGSVTVRSLALRQRFDLIRRYR